MSSCWRVNDDEFGIKSLRGRSQEQILRTALLLIHHVIHRWWGHDMEMWTFYSQENVLPQGPATYGSFRTASWCYLIRTTIQCSHALRFLKYWVIYRIRKKLLYLLFWLPTPVLPSKIYIFVCLGFYKWRCLCCKIWPRKYTWLHGKSEKITRFQHCFSRLPNAYQNRICKSTFLVEVF